MARELSKQGPKGEPLLSRIQEQHHPKQEAACCFRDGEHQLRCDKEGAKTQGQDSREVQSGMDLKTGKACIVRLSEVNAGSHSGFSLHNPLPKTLFCLCSLLALNPLTSA